MKTIEKLLWVIFILAITFRSIINIPSPIPLFIGLTLALFYFAGTFHLFKKIIPNLNKKSIPIIAGFIFSFSVIAISFKIMQWPGSTVNLVLALISIIILITTILLKLKKTNNKNSSTLFRIILKKSFIFLIFLILLLCFTFFVPINVQKSIIPLTN